MSHRILARGLGGDDSSNQLLSTANERQLEHFRAQMKLLPALKAALLLHRLADEKFERVAQLKLLSSICQVESSALHTGASEKQRELFRHTCLLVSAAKARQLCNGIDSPDGCSHEVKLLVKAAEEMLSGETQLTAVKILGNLGALESFTLLESLWTNSSLSLSLRIGAIDATRHFPSTILIARSLLPMLQRRGEARQLKLAIIMRLQDAESATKQELLRAIPTLMGFYGEADMCPLGYDSNAASISEKLYGLLRSQHKSPAGNHKNSATSFAKHYQLAFGGRIPGSLAAAMSIAYGGG